MPAAVDESTLAPAGELVLDTDEPKAFQLTDDVLSNLTALELSHVDSFVFGDKVAAAAAKRCKRAPGLECKTYPDDPRWPNEQVWNVFDRMTGGALIKTVPIGAVCYEDSGHYDEAKCQEVLDNWTESATQYVHPRRLQSSLACC